MSRNGTSKFSGKLTELFPGFSKRWQGALYGILNNKYGEPERTPEFYMELLDKGIPYLGGDSDKLWKMMSKHGIRRGDPLRKIAELLRANEVPRYGSFRGDTDVGSILVRRVSTSRLAHLSEMEYFLVALLDNITIAEVPYFKEVGNEGYSSYRKHVLSSERCLVYKDSLERFQKDPLASVHRLVKEHDEVRRDLIQFANCQYGAAKEALGKDRCGYKDPGAAVHDALELTTPPSVEDIEQMVAQYERALEASRILLDLLKNPRPVLTDPYEIFLKNLPLVALGVGIDGCNHKSLTVAKGLAEYILANIDIEP